MRPPIRIAVLECDVPLENTKAKYGGYGGVFESLFREAAKALDEPKIDSESGLQFTKWDVVNEPDTYPKLEDIDAVLLTGASTLNVSYFELCLLAVLTAGFPRIQLI